MSRIALPSLTLLAVGLAAVVALEFKSADRPTVAVLYERSVAPVKSSGGPGHGLSDPWDEWLATSLARPLFEPDRRPPANAAGPIAQSRLPRLAGIIITPTERSAIFVGPRGEHAIVLVTGSRLNDFVVRSIDPYSVTIMTPDGLRSLRPTFQTSDSSQASPPPASPTAFVALPPPPAGSPGAFAAIRGLSGRPLGLAANPDQNSPLTAPTAEGPARSSAQAASGNSP